MDVIKELKFLRNSQKKNRRGGGGGSGWGVFGLGGCREDVNEELKFFLWGGGGWVGARGVGLGGQG